MPTSERALVQQRVRDCDTKIRAQRAIIESMQANGRDAENALNVLSALEASQALRLRQLRAIG